MTITSEYDRTAKAEARAAKKLRDNEEQEHQKLLKQAKTWLFGLYGEDNTKVSKMDEFKCLGVLRVILREAFGLPKNDAMIKGDITEIRLSNIQGALEKKGFDLENFMQEEHTAGEAVAVQCETQGQNSKFTGKHRVYDRDESISQRLRQCTKPKTKDRLAYFTRKTVSATHGTNDQKEERMSKQDKKWQKRRNQTLQYCRAGGVGDLFYDSGSTEDSQPAKKDALKLPKFGPWQKPK